MAKVEHTSDARVLVGIDISKHRHEVLIAGPGKSRRRRLTITNSTVEFMRLIAILREYGQPVWIGFEATGNYHRVLMYHLGVARFDLKLVSSVALARTREALHTTVGKRTTQRMRRSSRTCCRSARCRSFRTRWWLLRTTFKNCPRPKMQCRRPRPSCGTASCPITCRFTFRKPIVSIAARAQIGSWPSLRCSRHHT